MILKKNKMAKLLLVTLFKLLICTFLFKSLIVFSQQRDNYNFSIDVTKEDELKLSQIATVEYLIPLEGTDENHYLGPNQVEFDGSYIFMTFGFTPKSIYKYDLSGKLVKNITLDTSNIKGGIFFSCDTKNNLIYVWDKDNIVYKLNYEGNLIDKLEIPFSAPLFFYDNRIWGISVRHAHESIDNYFLYSVSETGECELVLNTDVKIDTTDFLNNMRPRLRIEPSFSETNKNMYFSLFFDQTIYKINSSGIKSFATFDFDNGKPDFGDYVACPPQILNGNLIFIGYRLQRKWYSFLYNIKNSKSYNLKGASIVDDIHSTENFHAKLLGNMRNGNFCYLIPSQNSDQYEKKRALTLVIMKIK